MSEDPVVTRAVHKEFRRRGLRRFLIKGGLVVGLILGGFFGVAVPTQSTYIDALHREAHLEQFAADAILDKFTSILSYLEGGREAAFLRNDKIDAGIKDLYREHKRKAIAYDAEANTLADGVQSLSISIATHLGLAIRAGIEGLGKPNLLDAQVYKHAAAGALAGGLVGLGVAALVTHRRRDNRNR